MQVLPGSLGIHIQDGGTAHEVGDVIDVPATCREDRSGPHFYEATQLIRKQFFCVIEERVLDSKRFLVCDWRSQKVPYGGARATQKNSCQTALTDVLCNWDVNSRNGLTPEYCGKRPPEQ